MRSQCDEAREKGPAELDRKARLAQCTGDEQSSSNWADDRMNDIPHRVRVGNLVDEEFDEVERTGGPEDDRILNSLDGGWQAGDPSQSGGNPDERQRGIEVNAGRECKAEDLAEYNERSGNHLFNVSEG